MNQIEKAKHFKELHIPGKPVVMFNVWDAGSAQAVAKGGARAIATGSWSVAAAQGYPDGEQIPLPLLETIAARIVASIDLPVTIDFEGAYATEPEAVADNVERLLNTGVIGINFEDWIVAGEGLYSTEDQARRIAAIRQRAEKVGIPMVINARTDLFLKEKDRSKHAGLIEQAKQRATAYAEAGATSFFVPGLADINLIKDICAASPLPVNVMMAKGVPSVAELAAVGVARISHGPGPYILTRSFLTKQSNCIYNDL